MLTTLFSLALILAAEGGPAPTVGMPARIDQLVLPGSELEAKPITDRMAPIVVRVVEVYPHGTAFRYDLIYHGLEPGDYDLKNSLRRKDGSSTADLPSIPVTIRALLPAGQIEPNRLALSGSPSLGGYRRLLFWGGIAWFGGLVMILYGGRKRRRQRAEAVLRRPMTLAERLKPLVENARAGTLQPGQQAELERLLIGFWQRKLQVAQVDAVEAIATLRRHDQAGALLRQLEEWLHRPDPAGPVDVAALLEPYRDLPVDALEPQAAGRSS